MLSADQITTWIIVTIALIPALDRVIQWFRPVKREVSFTEKFATTDQLQEVESDLSERIDGVDKDLKTLANQIATNGETRKAAIEAKVEAARKEASEGHSKLQADVSSLSGQLSAVSARLQTTSESTTAQLNNLSNKLDRFIERGNGRHDH